MLCTVTPNQIATILMNSATPACKRSSHPTLLTNEFPLRRMGQGRSWNLLLSIRPLFQTSRMQCCLNCHGPWRARGLGEGAPSIQPWGSSPGLGTDLPFAVLRSLVLLPLTPDLYVLIGFPWCTLMELNLYLLLGQCKERGKCCLVSAHGENSYNTMPTIFFSLSPGITICIIMLGFSWDHFGKRSLSGGLQPQWLQCLWARE